MTTVTLCRPPAKEPLRQLPSEDGLAGSQDWEALGALARLGRELPGDVRVVVVRCEDAAVAATTPLSALAGLPEAEIERQLAVASDAVSWLRRPDLLSVAVVPGRVDGIALAAALASDLRLLADGAELAVTEIAAGLVAGLGVTTRLVQLAGYSRALEWCLTGRSISAEEARRAGLANLVVPSAELDSAASGVISRLLTADRDAANETKALLLGAESQLAGVRASRPDEAELAAVTRLLRDLSIRRTYRGRGD